MRRHPVFTNYSLTRDGQVWSHPSERFLKQSRLYGYCKIRLWSATTGYKSLSVHRLVWEAYNGRLIPPGMEIDHKDRNRANNNLDNLECVTGEENRARAGLASKPVVLFKVVDENPLVFGSVTEACKALGLNIGNAYKALYRPRRTVDGWVIRFGEERP